MPWHSLVRANLLVMTTASLLLVPVARPSARPRYGGTLRVQTEARILSLNPLALSAGTESAPAFGRVASLVFERLVRFDDAGQVAPALATVWHADPQHRQWQFRLRRDVTFHDGTPLTPSAVVGSLEGRERGWRVSLFGETVLIQTDEPRPDLLFELCQPRNAIFRHSSTGTLLGTGPFQISAFAPGEQVLLTAFETYWGGRPFLDAIELHMGRPLRQQRIDLELGRADLVEFSAVEALGAHGANFIVWSSRPVELLVLVFPQTGPGANLRLREAIASAVDRAAIHQVLLRRLGESTGALLPNWLTGYAFLFRAQQDMALARNLFATISTQPSALRLAYDSTDPLARAVAERVALDVREAGLLVQPERRDSERPGLETDVRLVRWHLQAANAAAALRELAERFGMSEMLPGVDLQSPLASYEAEKALLDGYRLMPLIYMPVAFGRHARVKNWSASAVAEWNLADIWLEGPPAEQPESEQQ